MKNDKETFVRLERLAEYFTYITVILGLLVIQLPFPFSINRPIVILIALSTAGFSIVWHRFTPKDFTGKTKNFIEGVVDVLAISLVVHFTGGVEGFFTFIYFLPILNVAANMETSYTLGIVGITYSFLIIEGLSQAQLNGIGAYSITIFHMWMIGIVAAYSRLLSRELNVAKKKEEEIKVEQIHEVGKLKDEFVFIISHELRSPITAIRGYLELLLNSGKSKLNPAVSKAFYTANKLANLVSILLEISRLETGRIRFYLQKLNVKQTVEDSLKGVSTDSLAKHVDIVLKIPSNYEVTTDPERFIEILTILVENAIRFSPEYGKVKISALRSLNEVSLQITDNGPGIDPEMKEHLFDKFYKPKNNDKEIKGLGLGLYVVKALMNDMRGDVKVQTSSKGTTFTLFFPIVTY